jgi:hypothetical protein
MAEENTKRSGEYINKYESLADGFDEEYGVDTEGLDLNNYGAVSFSF